MALADEDVIDWWNALYRDVEPIEAKHQPKRGAIGVEHDHDDVVKAQSPPTPGGKRSVSGTNSGGNSTAAAAAAAAAAGANATIDDSASVVSGIGGPTAEQDSDDESDDGRIQSVDPQLRRPSTMMAGRFLKKVKLMKPDKKPYGPPPFEDPTARRYEVFMDSAHALSGLQFSLKLSNICTYHDRLVLVVYGSVPYAAADAAANASSAKRFGSTNNAVPASTTQQIASQSNSWQVICRTEAKTIQEKPSYSESFIGEVKIFFNTLGIPNLEDYRDIKIHVLRIDNESSNSSTKDGARSGGNTGTGQQSLLAKCVIAKRVFDFKPPIMIKMKVIQPPIMDIAVPQLKEPEVLLGIVKLTSYHLDDCRKWFQSSFRAAPYSEVLYSFGSNSGLTLSIEQLYASRYSTAVGLALVSLWQKERDGQYRAMREEVAEHMRRVDALTILSGVQAPVSPVLASSLGDNSGLSSMNATGSSLSVSPPNSTMGANTTAIAALEEQKKKIIESARLSLETMDEICQENNELLQLIIHEFHNASRGADVKCNVIGAEVGGAVLRRSTWKKYTVWQYCATNLNVHLLTSRVFSFQEVLDADSVGGNTRRLHCIPTITLGCPCAHELKFSDGGLRRIFSEITTIEQKICWLQAIQFPNLTLIEQLFHSHPKEAASLFNMKVPSSGMFYFQSFTPEEKALIFKRKHELTRRIDICASQAMGCAVTTIRTILLLATKLSGNYFDILARSLKIGFMVTFQSMLSTQGHEVGMIEDLEIAALWLSLVTVRLVVPVEEPTTSGGCESQNADAPMSTPSSSRHHKTSKLRSADGESVLVGFGEGVSCRRDATGRLIMDIEISQEEGDCVIFAKNYMSGFVARTIQTFSANRVVPYAFQFSPPIIQAENEPSVRVVAVVEMLGLAFTQGVNEMQTLANLSSSRDCLKQGEINFAALVRLRSFFQAYRAALTYQLDANREKMTVFIQTMNNNGTNTAPTRNTLAQLRKGSMRNSIYIGNNTGGIPKEMVDRKVEQFVTKVLQYNDRLLTQVEESIQHSMETPYEKHVDVLLRTSSLCRAMGGPVGILCKSGKDRTSMGVTLENTRSLVEDIGILNGKDCCDLMRLQGVRRMNVYANTGQSMFAFNQIQRRALPPCYRPPPNTFAGNVVT
jgi:hypothetical protein